MATLMDRQSQLKKQIRSEKTRLDKAQIQIMDSIEHMIVLIEKEIDQIEHELRQCVQSCSVCSDIFTILIKDNGCGQKHRLGRAGLPRWTRETQTKPDAALAGLAPYVQDSGDYKGIKKNWRWQG